MPLALRLTRFLKRLHPNQVEIARNLRVRKALLRMIRRMEMEADHEQAMGNGHLADRMRRMAASHMARYQLTIRS